VVLSRYPHLVQQRQRWFVRMVVPADVREVIGQSVFKMPTGHTDPHRAATAAVPIIADFQQRIRSARDAGKRFEHFTAEQLAERYRKERETDPDRAEITKITDAINFVLKGPRPYLEGPRQGGTECGLRGSRSPTVAAPRQ
jgi:hypothetical protein